MAPNFSCRILVNNLHHMAEPVLPLIKTKITFKSISEGISILTTTMKKMKYCFISVYTPTSESTVKDSEKTRTFYEQLSDITKSDINENGEKLIETCNLHNLRITDTFFKHKPTHQTTWKSPAPYKNVKDSKTKSFQKNPYRNQIDYILVRNCETIKITDSKSTTNKITMSDHKPVIMKTIIVFKKHFKKRKIEKIDYR